MPITRNTLRTAAGPSDWFTGAVHIDTLASPSQRLAPSHRRNSQGWGRLRWARRVHRPVALGALIERQFVPAAHAALSIPGNVGLRDHSLGGDAHQKLPRHRVPPPEFPGPALAHVAGTDRGGE